MGTIDLHIHTVKSPCGLHTLLEILELAKKKGMEMVAITDHDFGDGHGIRVFSYRFPSHWNGIRVLKGIEFSIRDGGQIRVPRAIKIRDLEICLAGFHESERSIRNNPKQCTDDLEACLSRYPFVDVLTHPTINGFELEPARCAELLHRFQVAIEVNNSALKYGKEQKDRLLDLLSHCQPYRIPVVLNSDTHTAEELGEDRLGQEVIAAAGILPECILNTSVERVLAFVEKRRCHKLQHLQPPS